MFINILKIKTPTSLTSRCLLSPIQAYKKRHKTINLLLSSVLMDRDKVDFATEDYDCAVLLCNGEFGEDISYSYMISSYQVDFSELIPKSSYIHELDSYVFKDSIKVAFQLHNQSSNVNLSLYNIFDLTEKTIINGYRGMGVYDFYLNIYNDFQEELDEGKFKLKLIVDQSPVDSIYVVYDKNKN